MARIVIAGCGDVGTALGLRLSDAGHQVWGLRRQPQGLPSPLTPLAADLSVPASLALPPALDAVYYTAAAGGYSEARYRAAYVDGVANLLAALRNTGQTPRMTLVSSTSVYGQCDGEWVDEDSPAEADGFAGRCLREGEQRLWDSALPATVVRLAGIYGPGRNRLIDKLKNGRARCTPGVYSNRIHRDDCAGFLAYLFSLDKPAPLYLGVDDRPAPLCEVLWWLAARLGVAGPTLSAGHDSQRQPSNKRCRNQRLRASGYSLLYPSFEHGYTAMLAAASA